MPRRARKISETGVYHVILRAVNQQQIFEEEADFLKFRWMLKDCVQKYDIQIYAYCLMDNHVHFVVAAELKELSAAFQSFNIRFVLWYNKKYQRFGHLFQGRFLSFPIISESHLLKTICYVHENPVKANMCRAANEYRWSSCRAYYGKKDSLVSLDAVIEILGSIYDVQRYFAHVDDRDLENCGCEPVIPTIRHIDEHALEIFRDLTGCRSPYDFQQLPRKRRYDLVRQLLERNLTQSQIARFAGISRTTVHRIRKN